MLSEPNISYKPFWGIYRPLKSWRANSPNPIQIYCAIKKGRNPAPIKVEISTRPLRQLYDTENYQRLQPDFE